LRAAGAIIPMNEAMNDANISIKDGRGGLLPLPFHF
jgi:hypothetical protein